MQDATMANTEVLLSPRDVAERLNVSLRMVHTSLRRELPWIKMGGKLLRLPERDLVRWLAEHQNRAA